MEIYVPMITAILFQDALIQLLLAMMQTHVRMMLVSEGLVSTL